ncbi:hypothetical protein LCGC14_1037920 [marine sediment metagenome]|uniref:Outer membrane protein beta-barrel domain-containing protein n=1 Tax=marine sediment metagenome TaxID=412755 RepID=A0A0F9MX99_9ZZZZ
MKFYIYLFFFCIINLLLLFQSLTALAQSITAGVRINQSINSISKRNTPDINSSNPDIISNRFTNYFSVDVLGEKISANNTIYRLTLGMNRQSDKTYYSNNTYNGETQTQSREFNFNAYSIGIGAGKLYSHEKIQLRIGVEFITLIRMPKNESYFNQSIDANGNVYGTSEIAVESPAEYFYRLNTFFSIYYNCWKPLYIGIEIGNGFYYNVQNGTKTSNANYYDVNNNLINTVAQTEKIKYSNISSSFLNPSIGLIYRL